MGVSICHCNKDNQNIQTSYTNYPLVDETNNNKNKKKYFNQYNAHNRNSKKIRAPLETQNKNENIINVNIINVNKDNDYSKNYSSSGLNNNTTNNVSDNYIYHSKNRISPEIDKEKSTAIKNFEDKIKQFAEYISEEKYKEIENNKIIKKIEENINNNYNNFNIDCNSDNTKSKEKCFTLPALLFKKDKSIYKGSWNFKGKKEGFGIYIDSKGNKYIGNWLNDQFNGKGILISIKGDFYKGEFNKGKMEGNGIYHSSKEKYNYFGEFKNNKFNGKGKIIYDDNTIYEGDFSDGYMEGEGNILFSDGSYYKGNFEKNKYNGKGKFFFESGKKYSGDWKNNAMDGMGIFTWDNDTKYNGEYKNNVREGNGVYSFGANLYDGFWVNNLPHGKGTLLNEGLRIEGQFRYGKIIEVTETKGANREVRVKFTLFQSAISLGPKNSSKKTLPKVNPEMLDDKKDSPKQCKSSKYNRVKSHSVRKSKEKKDFRRYKSKENIKIKDKKKKSLKDL